MEDAAIDVTASEAHARVQHHNGTGKFPADAKILCYLNKCLDMQSSPLDVDPEVFVEPLLAYKLMSFIVCLLEVSNLACYGEGANY